MIYLVLSVSPDAVMVIKSTIPVGYIRSLYVKYVLHSLANRNFKARSLTFFSPRNFAWESSTVWHLYLSHIIVGYPKIIDGSEFTEENAAINVIGNSGAEEYAHIFAELLQKGAVKQNIAILFIGLKETEAIKFFVNTCLALRVSDFNELDTYAEMKGGDSQVIIEG